MPNRRSFLKTVGLATAGTLGGSHLRAQAETQSAAAKPTTIPGTPQEPVRVLDPKIDLNRHDGGLSPAVGVELIQVMRANRTHPEWAEDFGFTYNHAPMLCYWKGKFYLEWLSNTYGEQTPPGHTLVATSTDGRTWSKAQVMFPIYYFDVPPFRNSTSQPGMAIMHQRMGFYVAPNGRLLVLAFYGWDNPFGPGGVGRVVREAYQDGTYGPIYFIKYNPHFRQTFGRDIHEEDPGWNEQNAKNPFTPGDAPMPVLYYKHSPDPGFVEACEALLADPLKTMQWWEEEGDPATLFKGPPSARFPQGRMTRWEAPSVYHRQDGVAVSVWKWSGAALSTDEGKTWSDVVAVPTIITAGAKVWGQKTSDGRYALVYNPAKDGYHRWPLAAATGDDGITFDHMLLVEGDVYPRRYMGRAKDFGFQYTRGISEGNGTPPGTDMWLTYSTKEDIWVARVPVPIRGSVEGPVSDNFDDMEVDGPIKDWSIRRGPWIRVGIVAFPSARNKSLQLEDRDPYNYARAERVFAQGASKTILARVYAHQTNTGQLNVEVLNHTGHRAVRLVFGPDGRVRVTDGARSVDAGPYIANTWYNLAIQVDAANGTYSATLDGKPIARAAAFMEPTSDVNRLCFRTGDPYPEPTRKTSRDLSGRDVPNAGEPAPPAAYNIDDVSVN
jgi:Sialidase-like, CBM domain